MKNDVFKEPMIRRLISRHPLAVDLILLLVIGVTMLFPFLGQNHNWASREIRHAEIMREMAETGDFLIPQLMGEVYYDKPPVMHFVGATLMRASNEPSLSHARFPSAFAALVSMFAVYGIGRLLGGRQIAFWGALALLAMPGFWLMARVARPDLTLVVLILLSCLFLGWSMQSPRGTGKTGWLIASGMASALAIITKGPYGLMVPLLFLAIAPWENPMLIRPGWRFIWFGVGLTITLTAWATPVYLRDGGEYLRGVIFQEDLATGGGRGHFEAFYWYLGPVLLESLPVILFLPLAIRQWRRDRQFPAALAIAGVILFVISCVPGKRKHYLLPLLPFLALGLASGIAFVVEQHRRLRHLAIATVIGGMMAGPLYHGPILHWLRPQGDSEWDFITDVAEALPSGATVVCFDSMAEYLAWVRRDYGGIISVESLAEAEAALSAGDEDRYLVASDDDLLALEQDPDLGALHPVLEHSIDRKGPWLLARLDK
jgi:4-amino-4-deoxy-L-arabinose transferase-like glycosyltransferase